MAQEISQIELCTGLYLLGVGFDPRDKTGQTSSRQSTIDRMLHINNVPLYTVSQLN